MAAVVATAAIVAIAIAIVYRLRASLRWLDDRFHAHQTYKIPRFDDNDTARENPLYSKSLTYLNSLPLLELSECANVFSSTCRKPNDFWFHIEANTPIHDSFLGSCLSWTLSTDPSPYLLLRVRRRDRHRVLRPYLHHVQAVADDNDLRRKELRLFYIGPRGRWNSVPMSHPATLDTVVIDAELRSRVKSDLESFLKGRSYYARLGRVWKRSYLLYGPTGTGKSTFAAAMAKFLNYDMYELDLSTVSAAEIKPLLLRTGPRSVILVENLDRHAEFASLMTGYADGVFACCGDERVMVFTTSGDKEAVPGRIDVQLHFPLCDFVKFKSLASGYLGLKDHKLYPQVEEGFENGARLSPDEVGEIMIANRESPSRAIKTVIGALHRSSPSSSARMFYSGSLRKSPSESGSTKADDTDTARSVTVRELRNLYGLIRTRGAGSRKDGTMSVQMAAAAAATANAAAAAEVANYLDRSSEWAKIPT